MNPPSPRPKAYSYIRFSTPEQAAGHSLERQTAAARDYATRQGLELDEELFQDRGMSAFKGRNKQQGALGAFLTAVEEGRVARGSYLLVESLDRISRQTARRAIRTMEDIITEGITVVDLSDGGRAYSEETLDNDPIALVMMIMRFMRANEESALKSERVAKAYSAKRERARNGNSNGKPFTRMLPAWIAWSEEKTAHVLVPERAKIVRQMFAKAAAGWGQHRIAHWLNARGVAPWSIGKRKATHWHRSYVKKILTNTAVVGTFTPHRTLKEESGRRIRKPLEAIEGYYPAVIERELFERVAARESATAPRGRNANNKPASIFAGVLKCAHCGGPVTRVSKGKHVYLICSRAHARAGACKRQAIAYSAAEDAMTENARAIVDDAPRGYDTDELESEIAGWEETADTLAEEANALVDELATAKSEAVRRRLREKERELEEAQRTLRDLQRRRDTLAEPYVLRRLNTLREALQRKPLDVVTANSTLKEAVSKIVMDAEAGRLVIYWRHAEEPSEGVPVHSRHSRVFD
jgi:DNA invertase Pin-like site-specific DNA recombinase